MRKLHIDIETFSTIDIKHGVYKYAEGVELLLFAYAFDSAPVNVLDCTNPSTENEILELLSMAKCKGYDFCAHNANFERVILNKFFPFVKNILWQCTKIRAYAHSLPGSLQELCVIYNLPSDKAKDKVGKQLIQLFCKPQKDGSVCTRHTHPEEWRNFIEYCRLDVEAERELDKKLPLWNHTPDEIALWQLDQDINDRGFLVDAELAECAISEVTKDKESKDTKTRSLTKGDVNAATQRDALLKHILEIYGVDLPDLTISTLTRRLEDPDLPEPVKELINLRLQSSGTSTKKYQTLINAVSSDNRLRGTLQFCGASRTGRWSGRIFQPQNLPRPKFKSEDIELGINTLKNGIADVVFDDVKAIASSAIRGVIVAPPGKKLVIADLSSIEGRVLAWLAGEEWKIQAYRDYDAGIGYDLYKLTYAKTFNIEPQDVTKEQRQLGKVLELALGYGGGVGAFITFANGYNIDLDDVAQKADTVYWAKRDAQAYWEHANTEGKTYGLSESTFVALDAIKRMWRFANAQIENFWRDLEYDYKSVAGGDFAKERLRYTTDKKGSWLRIKLPSNRFLCYAGARIDNNKCKYLGVNTYSKQWGYLSTYGGKLAENLTQATSRDIFAHGIQEAEKQGYKIVLSVHDELITEVPDNADFSTRGLIKCMTKSPIWALDLPLAASGFETHRYRKDD